MIKFILECLYFLLPAALATLTPQLSAHFKILESLNRPIDYYKTWRDKRIFGDHKTVRGYVVGVGTGIITGFLQYTLSYVEFFSNNSLINYTNLFIALSSGFLLSFGALAGDSIKSFFKRQYSIAPGRSWFFFDQVDFIIGGIIFSLPIAVLEIRYYLAMVIIYLAVHITTTSIGYLLGVKESWI